MPVGRFEDFRVLAESFRELFIVVDALDECTYNNRPDMIGFLRQIMQALPLAKIFVTSRPEVDIARTFQAEKLPTLKVDVASVQPDIKKYIEDEGRHLRRGRNGVQLCIRSDALAAEVVQFLTRESAGMYDPPCPIQYW